MKDKILKNRYTLLGTALSVYVLVLVLEGALTGRQHEWWLIDNSLLEMDLRQAIDMGNIDVDF